MVSERGTQLPVPWFEQVVARGYRLGVLLGYGDERAHASFPVSRVQQVACPDQVLVGVGLGGMSDPISWLRRCWVLAPASPSRGVRLEKQPVRTVPLVNGPPVVGVAFRGAASLAPPSGASRAGRAVPLHCRFADGAVWCVQASQENQTLMNGSRPYSSNTSKSVSDTFWSPSRLRDTTYEQFRSLLPHKAQEPILDTHSGV